MLTSPGLSGNVNRRTGQPACCHGRRWPRPHADPARKGDSHPLAWGRHLVVTSGQVVGGARWAWTHRPRRKAVGLASRSASRDRAAGAAPSATTAPHHAKHHHRNDHDDQHPQPSRHGGLLGRAGAVRADATAAQPGRQLTARRSPGPGSTAPLRAGWRGPLHNRPDATTASPTGGLWRGREEFALLGWGNNPSMVMLRRNGRRSDAIAGTIVRAFGETRTCAEDACTARLSRYNPARHCAIHQGWDGQEVPLPRRRRP